MINLITHGKRNFGSNPSHTHEGVLQIGRLVLKERLLPLVVIGTGRRFQEIYNLMICNRQLDPNIPVKYSPFCGSADGLEANKNVILVNGVTVGLDDYIGITNDCFDAWKFISSLPDDTIMCAGGELLTALGLKDINEGGQLFELDPRAKTGKKIS